MDQSMIETMKANRDKARDELQAALNKITVKTVAELTDFEIAFLRARIDYLTVEEKERYASVLINKKRKIIDYTEE